MVIQTLATDNSELPIGVFDSGMGGLTVLRALKQLLPNESFIYLGDTARLPYGTKSQDTVIRYATQMAKILVEQQIKMMVVACNTATTSALTHLITLLPNMPIIGVVEPGAQQAVATTKNNCIAVLATETTIHSGIYQNTIKRLNPNIKVITQSCGLFVALAEEGCTDDDVAHAAVKRYLTPVLNQHEKFDCIVLGCTHFPVLINPLKKILRAEVNIIDSAHATAESVKLSLLNLNMVNKSLKVPSIKYLVTDLPQRFARVGEIFFGKVINPDSIHLVDL